MKVGRWSTTPGSNNSTPPDGWPEGQAPSTVNDCAREMMAAIRSLINDAQYIDQDFTPTYISATTFSVPGNQTSAIHADRRIKIFDATAGAATVLYATVVTASFTTVTTIQISADAGQLTASLSSFALAILSKMNDSLPRNLSIYGAGGGGGGGTSLSSANITGALTVGGAVRFGSTLSVSGDAKVRGNFHVSGQGTMSRHVDFEQSIFVAGAGNFAATVSAAAVATVNAAKAWGHITVAGGAVTLQTQFNISSVVDSGPGTYDFIFSNALSSTAYAAIAFCQNDGITHMFATHNGTSQRTTGAYRVETVSSLTLTSTDASVVSVSFFR